MFRHVQQRSIGSLGSSLAESNSKLKRPEPWEMAPPGFFRVNGYFRTVKGKRFPVVSYLKHLRGGHPDRLTRQNLLFLFWNSTKKYPPTGDVVGFPGKGRELDPVIQFWLDYWRSRGIPLAGAAPLLVKVVIALESGFNPVADPHDPQSTAFGLMQVTRTALRSMAGIPHGNGQVDVKKNQVLISSHPDLSDPVLNIAAGIRWFGYKFLTIPKGSPRSVHNMLRNYKGWNVGERYARKVLALYEKSK